jgi:hypothetical protein
MDEEPGIRDAIHRVVELRRELRCQTITVRWYERPPLGAVTLIVDYEGWQLFHNGEPVPMRSTEG